MFMDLRAAASKQKRGVSTDPALSKEMEVANLRKQIDEYDHQYYNGPKPAIR